MSDLVPRSGGAIAPILTDSEIDRMYRIALAVARSKLGRKNANDQETADLFFTKMLIGRELGLSAGQAVSGGLYIFDGNVQMHYATLLRAVKAHGWDYEIEWLNEDGFNGAQSADNSGVALTFISPSGDRKGPSKFTVADAKVANLWNKPGKGGGPGVWKASPKNMCLARATSNGVKAYVPEATGGVPVYTEGDDLDTLHVENLADGHGDGSDPGWGTVAPDLAHKIERMVKRAEKAGYHDMGNLDSVKMTLNHASEAVIVDWLRAMDLKLKELADKAAEPVDAEVVEEKAE